MRRKVNIMTRMRNRREERGEPVGEEEKGMEKNGRGEYELDERIK